MGLIYNMDETKRTAIIDKNGNNILANVVESIDNPGTYGLVALNPDWSSIAAWWSNLPYTAINSSVTITEWNVYGVDATSGDINLTLSNGTVAWKVLTVKKLDNTDNIVYINNKILLCCL